MADPNPAALDFLLTRRSHPPKTLTTPVPDRAVLTRLLTAATRVPDHGKLEPWRLLVLEKPALMRLSQLAANHAKYSKMDPEKAAKGVAQFADANLIVVVISSPKDSEKVPDIEQVYSAGAVCVSLVNAALADGWGTAWLSNWVAHDLAFIRQAFDLSTRESVAGLIHIGTATQVPPERPRPDIGSVVRWVSK